MVVIMGMGMEMLCLRLEVIGMTKHRIAVMSMVDIMGIISLDRVCSTWGKPTSYLRNDNI